MALNLAQLLGVKKINHSDIGQRLVDECNWSVSAKGPNGATIREELPKGTTDAAAAKILVVAASRIASKDSKNGLTVRQSLESRSKEHTASKTAALQGMSAETHSELIEGFASAFGVDDEETAQECAKNITQRLGDLAPKVATTTQLPDSVADRRKQAALAIAGDNQDAIDVINETDWTDEQSGNDALEAIRESVVV